MDFDTLAKKLSGLTGKVAKLSPAVAGVDALMQAFQELKTPKTQRQNLEFIAALIKVVSEGHLTADTIKALSFVRSGNTVSIKVTVTPEVAKRLPHSRPKARKKKVLEPTK